MNLYLVQHAEPKREEEDPQKPLSEKGWSDIGKVAAFIVEHTNIQVISIMHSGKTRARQTAEALAEHLNPPEGVKEAEGLESLADPSRWAQRLAETKEDIMLVGHLPHLSKLSAHLLCQDENKRIVNFQMGGIVCLGRDESGIWSVRWMVIPQILA
ncbi:MAG: phosphohistidine phosphatase SixA [Deltaproteobacteria bacterium]|nr:phosphohistidine phosphatase SixA [Deltaproteobacteria bacterium]